MKPNVTPEYLKSQGLSKTFPERFWAKVDKNGPVPAHRPELGPCWLWTGATYKGGYGQIRPNHRDNCIRAPRAAWLLMRGPIPEGFQVLHSCDNPGCVNDAHLFLGTTIDNVQDCIKKGRRGLTGNKGELRWNHKLTWAMAEKARTLFASGKISQREIARQFGVSHTAIRLCVIGRTWNR